MIKKKVVMLGSFAVGKTSLVQQFVNSIFSEKYQTTIGVKIDQKNVNLNGQEVNLLLWDIHGNDDYQKVKPAYLMGASGCFVVIDGTRKASLNVANELIETVNSTVPNAVVLILINKSDLKDEWEIDTFDIDNLKSRGFQIIETSAKTNTGVDDAFTTLTNLMLS
ncbi:MAG: GTP-binding protein [Marinilabiliales bacterium]|nr:MAG: GTP-binding protein [Marinilabiliales bacterium]